MPRGVWADGRMGIGPDASHCHSERSEESHPSTRRLVPHDAESGKPRLPLDWVEAWACGDLGGGTLTLALSLGERGQDVSSCWGIGVPDCTVARLPAGWGWRGLGCVV
jgi:hypothetical protein